VTQQFDESMKEIVLGLVAIGTAPYSVSKIEDVFAKDPVPIEQKIDALETADDILKSSNFHRAVEEYIQRLQKGDPDSEEKDTKINPVQDIPPDKSDSQIKAIASTLIKPVEIYGTDISEPRNKRFLRPYKDDTGVYTIGIGHKIGNGSKAAKNKWVKKYGHTITPKFAEKLFDKQLDYHLNRVKEIFGATFNYFTDGQAAVLVDISYRGDLLPDMDWVKLLQSGKNIEAANEYLDHEEYKKRKKKGQDGVVKRMERNAGILANKT
jgi:GH24 family phage-related lysozyme (muramidase)